MSWLRRERSPLARFALSAAEAPADLDAAYAALAELAATTPDRWAAWKLGGTNHASRADFGVSRGYFGPLDRDEVLEQPAVAPGFPLAELKGEVELALRLGPDGKQPDAWAIALEMPASPLTNLPQAGVAALIADRCAAGALVLGRSRDMPAPDFAGTRFVQEINGVPVAKGGMADLVAPPLAILDEFLAIALAQGFSPRAGQWVATGGLTPCITYHPGDRLRVLCGGEVELDLIIGTGA